MNNKIQHICKNCGAKYENYKINSDFCSMDCKRMYNNIPYNCDTCGKDIFIKRYKAIAINEGKQHGAYCSRKCADIGNRNSVVKVCEYCGEEFITFKSTEEQKYCSRECFKKDKNEKAITTKLKTCPICFNEFYPSRTTQVYCSYKCSAIAQQNRIVCKCEYCGEEFERIKSEVEKNNKHYCSRACKWLDMAWSQHDQAILKEYYGKIKNKEILPLLENNYSEKALKSQAGRMGLYNNRHWTKEEEDILMNSYSKMPLVKVMELLPNRTKTSIIGKAGTMELLSYNYLESKYSEEENLFLQDNYLSMTDKELGDELNRSANGISQHLRNIGLIRPHEIGKYEDLNKYIRARLQPWKNHYREERNYICCVTGSRSNIIVHHIRGFNLIMNECLNDTDFQLKENFDDYKAEELESLFEYFLKLQEEYGEYCCVNSDIHKLFHKKYGYGNNTREQWDEFVNNYQK